MPLDEAGELRGVLREARAAAGRLSWLTPDDVVAVLARGSRGWCWRTPATSSNSLLSFASRPSSVLPVVTRVAQGRGDLGEHVGVEVGRPRQQPEVLDERGDLRVDPLEVGVERLEVLAELVAAALERGGERVEGLVDLGRLDGAQQRVEVVERLLDLDGHLGLLDRVAGLDAVAGRAVLGDLRARRTSRRTASWARSRAVTLAGMVSISLGVEAELEVGAVAVGASCRAPRRRCTPRTLTSARSGSCRPDARGLQRDLVVVGELLGEDREGEPHAGAAAGR